MIFVIIVVAIVISEHFLKNYIEKNHKLNEKQELFNGNIIIQKHYNKGAFLNFMENKKELVKTVSAVFLGLLVLLFAFALPKKGNSLYKLGLALFLGGAISNVSDRFRRGYVIDYCTINFKKLKTVVFNLADVAIFLGGAFVLLASLISTVLQGSSDKAFK